MTRAALVILALALAAPVAHAEPKRLRTAQTYSGVGTGASAAVFLSAFLISQVQDGDVNLPLLYVGLGSSVFTPALGHWYTGRYLTPGMGIRAAAALFATYAVVKYQETIRCPNTVEYTECTSLGKEGLLILGVSAIAFVGGAALDFKTLADSVDRYNVRMQVMPAMLPTATGAPAAGLSLSGEF